MRSLSMLLGGALLFGVAGGSDRSGACGSCSSSKPAAQLQVGSMAPDLEANDHRGQSVALLGPEAPMTLVYFYPKDNTPG